MTGRILIAALVAAATTASTLPLFVRSARRRGWLIDRPGSRSSHEKPKVRGGGIAILLGLAAGLIAGRLLGVVLGDAAIALCLGAFAVGALGLVDDLRGLPAWSRLLVEVAIAAYVVSQTGPIDRLPLPPPVSLSVGPLAFLGSIVWLVGVMNFFNFMDGIDGLAPGQAALVCGEVLVAGWSSDASFLACIALAGIVGFLPYNLWPSRVFLGDVGSLMIGFLLAAFPLLALPARRSDAVLATSIGLTLFLLDPIETLIRRFRQGAPIGEPHRDHRYQQLARPGSPHGPVSGALLCVGFLLCSIGAMVYRWPYLGWLAVGCAIATFLLERQMAVRASARQKPEHALPIELG